MDALQKKLGTVTAGDLMKVDVLRLAPDALVKSAIELLQEHGITGAPVVDAEGRLVGMLSVTDVARVEHVAEGRLATEGREASVRAGAAEEEWEEEDLEGEILTMEDYGSTAATEGAPKVADWMTRKVIHVTPATSLKVLCATLARHTIHRVPVVEHGHLRGIVSALDVVECVANRL